MVFIKRFDWTLWPPNLGQHTIAAYYENTIFCQINAHCALTDTLVNSEGQGAYSRLFSAIFAHFDQFSPIFKEYPIRKCWGHVYSGRRVYLAKYNMMNLSYQCIYWYVYFLPTINAKWRWLHNAPEVPYFTERMQRGRAIALSLRCPLVFCFCTWRIHLVLYSSYFHECIDHWINKFMN